MRKQCVYYVHAVPLTEQHHLLFKTQLRKFYKSVQPVSSSPCSGETLSLRNSVCHLGHILSFNLSDDEHNSATSRDMCRKANYILRVFSCCDPIIVTTRLFTCFCLSLYGATLWRSSSPQLRALEVYFNNILRKIWLLPCHSHNATVHSIAGLTSIFNSAVKKFTC